MFTQTYEIRIYPHDIHPLERLAKQEKSFNILKEHSYLNGLSIYYRNAE